jgi:BTB/POZ domain
VTGLSDPLLVDKKSRRGHQPAATMKIATLGKPPMELSPVETLRFVIHGFDKLKEAQGECVTPPSLSAHGYHWTIDLFPRGNNNAGEGYVSFYLRLIDVDLTDAVETEFAVKFGVDNGFASEHMKATFSKIEMAWGCSDSDRECMLDKDNKVLTPNGTLIIDVQLQVYVEKREVWYPPTPIPNNGDTQRMLANLLETGRYSDITYKVGHQDFHLHRFILEERAPVLFQMMDEHPDQTIITLDDEEEDVDAAMFQIMVRYIYTSEWPAFVDAEVAKTILILADRFGCINLKLYMESVIVEKFLDEDNAADMLLLGDSHTCAQLKEPAIQIFKNQADVVMNTEGWKRVQESNALVVELFLSVTNDDDPEGQCVAELRNQLLQRGLDVDGSRETLVKRLTTKND